MKAFTSQKLPTVLVLCLSAFFLAGQTDCLPVQTLKQLYAANEDFQKKLQATFSNLQDLPDGTPNPWRGRDLNDLYDFLNDWYYFLPTADNGLDKIIEFSMLYYRNPAGLQFIREEPGRSWGLHFIEERGKYMDSPASAKGIRSWLENEDLPHEEFVMPIDSFQSFNEFFTRALKPGARPVDGMTDDAVVVSPADGVINLINNDLRRDELIPVKGRMTLNIAELLDNSEYVDKFIGGTALAVFLLPDNYHHYHAPATGILVESRESVGDRLFGMPDIPDMVNQGNPGYNKDFSVFENFRHGYFIIKTRDFGHIAMIPVGLQTIGSVVFAEAFKNISKGQEKQIYKGERLGHFAYGGSTVLLLFEKDRLNAMTVRQGQRIGELKRD